MSCHRLASGNLTARGDIGQDRPMFIERFSCARRRAAGSKPRNAQLNVKVIACAFQIGIVGKLQDAQVKIRLSRIGRSRIEPKECVDVIDLPTQFGDLVLAGPSGRPPRRHPFDDDSCLVHVFNVLKCNLADKRPAVTPEFDQTFGAHTLNGLPQRAAADAEGRGQLGFVDAFAAGHRATDNHRP